MGLAITIRYRKIRVVTHAPKIEYGKAVESTRVHPELFRFLLRGYALGTVSGRKTDSSTHLYNDRIENFLVQKLYSLRKVTLKVLEHASDTPSVSDTTLPGDVTQTIPAKGFSETNKSCPWYPKSGP